MSIPVSAIFFALFLHGFGKKCNPGRSWFKVSRRLPRIWYSLRSVEQTQFRPSLTAHLYCCWSGASQSLFVYFFPFGKCHIERWFCAKQESAERAAMRAVSVGSAYTACSDLRRKWQSGLMTIWASSIFMAAINSSSYAGSLFELYFSVLFLSGKVLVCSLLHVFTFVSPKRKVKWAANEWENSIFHVFRKSHIWPLPVFQHLTYIGISFFPWWCLLGLGRAWEKLALTVPV